MIVVAIHVTIRHPVLTSIDCWFVLVLLFTVQSLTEIFNLRNYFVFAQGNHFSAQSVTSPRSLNPTCSDTWSNMPTSRSELTHLKLVAAVHYKSMNSFYFILTSFCFLCSRSAAPTATTPATSLVPWSDTTTSNTQIRNTTMQDPGCLMPKLLNNKVLSYYDYNSSWWQAVWCAGWANPACVCVPGFRWYEVPRVRVCLWHKVGVEPPPEEQAQPQSGGGHLGGKQHPRVHTCHSERRHRVVFSSVDSGDYNVWLWGVRTEISSQALNNPFDAMKFLCSHYP